MPNLKSDSGQVADQKSDSNMPTDAQAEHRLLHIMLQGMPQMAWIQGVKDDSGFSNERVRNYFGLSKTSLDPINWSKVIHPEDLERALGFWNQMIQTGVGYDEPIRLQRVDGAFRWIAVRVFPIYDSSGELTHIGGTMHDIHELEESRIRMDQLQVVAHALSGVLTLDQAATLVIDKVCLALGANSGIFCRLSADKTFLEKVYERGSPGLDDANQLRAIQLDPELPVTASFVFGEAMFFANLEQRLIRFPKARPYAIASQNVGLITVPIIVDAHPVGVIAFGFKEEIVVDTNLKNFTIALAGQCAQALSRAEAYEFERRMRETTAENEARLRLALDASQVGLWEWDFASGRQWVAGRYANVFGYEVLPEDWDIRSVMNHCDPEDRELLQIEMDRFQDPATESPFNFRALRFRTPLGKLTWVQAVGAIVRNADGVPQKAFGVMMDVTPQRDIEAALNRAKEEAETADRAKTSFVANMSHEFRTPLTAILGFAEFLSRDSLTSEKRLNYTEGIRRNGQVLLKLVEDILDLSRVEAGRIRFDLQALHPRVLIEDVGDIFKDELNKKNLSLVFEGLNSLPNRFVTDPVRLRQILVNVVGNAVKFTEKGKITVSARLREIAALSYLEVTVEDSGIGLLETQFDRLFQAFGQAETSTSRKFGGTGLGLFISRGLARALGGEIELLKSTPNVGSTFIVRIADLKDQTHAPGETRETEVRTGEKFANQRVLIVEDTEDLRDFLGVYLREAGCQVEFAHDGIEVVELISKGADYDTILMDLHMPRMDGYTATAKLRELGCGIPIVAITARNLPEDRLRCFEIGFDAFMTKPLSLRELESTLRRMFRRRKPADR